MAIEALMHASIPPFVVNVAGPEMLSVRRIAETFGRMMGKSLLFSGFESDSSLLSNGQLGHRLFGYPRIPVAQVMQWLAQWVQEGGQMLDTPTHFENREGRF
jgi:nucleoside-diphosphate-sugar epimerase